MAGVFKGVAVFGSGPARFVEEQAGRLLFKEYAGSRNPNPYPGDGGVRNMRVRVEGRLVSGSRAELNTMMDTLRAESESGVSGLLVDGEGRTWPDMRLMELEHTGDVQAGQYYSIEYEALFVEIT